MSRRRPGWNDTEVTEINIVPVIDLCLVLLVILLILSPIMDSDSSDILLPKTTSKSSQENHLALTVNQDGKLGVKGENIEPEEIKDYIARLLAIQGNDTLIVVEADRRLPFKNLAEAMRLAKEAGAENLSIGAQSKEDEP